MKTTLMLDIEYDPRMTDPEGLACAMDRLMETALSTPGIMDEYGNPNVREFLVAAATGKLSGTDTLRALERAGAASRPEPDEELEVQRRWVLYNLATDQLLTTQVYTSYDEGVEDAAQMNDVLVLPLVIQDIVL